MLNIKKFNWVNKFSMERFKKIFAAGVIFVTVLSMSVVVAPKAGATASAGDLIKMAGLSTVYYLAADGKRYVLHYVTAREMFNVVRAAEGELNGNPGEYRDYTLKRCN